jgi:perosamine synthetase
MEFDFFDSSGCSFPKPRVPVLPPLTRHSLKKKLPDKQGARWQLEGAFMPLRKAVGARHYARGRYALYEAYRLAGIGESGALFAPSYHCSTMLDPALRLKAEIDFYPLNADLSPQLEAISAKLRAQTRPIKALLATHYFGFPHEFAPLAALCELYGVTLIEDCSHTLFAPTEVSARSTQNAVGETGRFGIASPYKFYPSEDGGLLWFNDESGHAAAPQHAPAAVAELRALRSSFQRNRTNRLALDTDRIGPDLQVAQAQEKSLGHDTKKPGDSLSIFYQPAEEGQQSLASSQWIFRHTNVTRLASARRENYRYWLDAVAGLAACKTLLPQLPADCVPYMFPLLIDSPQQHFHLLKLLGLPVWRWDEMAVSGCAVAAKYRLSLLHLPCHQELAPAQMDWMVQVVRQVLSSAGTSE